MNISNKEAVVNITGDRHTAVEIANWCRSKSLIHDVDYKWYMTSINSIVFEFRELSDATVVKEQWAT
jgi:hypothetical protein